MMGHQSRQMAMLFVDIESLIPETHLLRKIERMVSFDFIYDLLAPYYPATGRPSVDPVSMFKMLLIGYLYGIKSERRLVEEVQLNIAYRWFCGFELDDTIPNHSTFSKTRTRKWQQSSLFQKAFYEIVKQCIDSGLIDGEAMAADGSYIPANVSRESWINVETEVEQSMQSYLDSLDEELSNQPGFKKPPTKIVRKCRTTSQTDPDSGYINHGSKRGIGYLMEATVDCKHGILTGVDVYSANEKESVLILRHLERQINLGIPMSRLALDRGYETGAVHRGLELLGITGYIPAIQFSNPPEKYGFSYDPQLDAFICPEGVPLTYHRLNCSKSTGKYLRCYQVEGDACMRCPKRPGCFDKAGIRRRVLASSCYPAFFRGHQRVGTPEYLSMMRLRKIWAEGSFSVLKREHCISKIRKRGILAATEECLLAAMALNLKRMAKCHLSLSPNLLFCWGHDGFQQFFCFCQQVPYCTLSKDALKLYRIFRNEELQPMLNIYFGDMPSAIYNTEIYFKNTYEDSWILDDFAKKVIKKVDGSDVIDAQAIKSPVLGIIPPTELSGGVKTLLLIENCPDEVFNASTCGDNCARFILELAKAKDVTINLRHIMDFDKAKFTAKVLNDNSIVHNMEELLPIAARYV